MSDLTAAQKEAYARAESTVIHLMALELRHSLFPSGRFRYVAYDVDLSLSHEAGAPLDPSTSVTYTALGINLKEPTLNTESDAALTFQIDNVSGAAQPYISSAVESTEVIECTPRFYQFDTATDTDLGLIKALYYFVRNITITQQSIAFTAGTRNAKNQAFPSALYTAATNPGLL